MREGRLELPPLAGLDPKSSASANSATRAMERSDFTRISRPAATDCKIRGELCPRSWLYKNPRVHVGPGDGWIPGVPDRRGAGLSVGYGGQPIAGGRVSGGDVIAAVGVKVADLGVDPIDARVPDGVQRVRKRVRSGGVGHPPPADLQRAADNVGLAVAVEVADFDVDRGDSGAPGGAPGGGGEGGATIGSRHPARTGTLHAAGNGVLFVAGEVANLHVVAIGRPAPLAPPAASKSRSGIDADAPTAGLWHAGGNIGLAVALEVSGHHVHP